MITVQKIGFLVITVLFFSFDTPKLVRKKVADGITVYVPKDWHPMDELDLSERYPSVRAPIAGYTDEDRMADFSVNISATQWPDANMDLAQEFFKAAIMNSFDRVDMIEEGIRTLKKHKEVAYFEFESLVRGNRGLNNHESILMYTYIEYLVEPGRTVVFSFHCPRRMRADWQPVAREMMERITITE